MMQQGANDMAKNKKQALQEIYGDANNDEFPSEDDEDLTSEELSAALAEIINELKEKYGNEWTKHIGEVSK